jgi:hypothetical protein
LGKQGERGYGKTVMAFDEALSQVAALKGKNNFSEAEKHQLAQIYARLQLERDLLKSNDKQLTKVDLFNLGEDAGKRYGTTAVAKSDLRVALKGLGIPEQQLQGMIDVEKVGILDIIKNVNKNQESFRRKEMLKSGVSGAIMGFAGGILAQEAIHLGGEQVEKLWGGHYFKSHGTNFDHIRDWVKGSHLYQSHFGQGAAAGAAIDHAAGGGMWHSRDLNAHEWIDKIKDHVSGGQVEHIHTHDWYDDNTSGQSAAEHIHNANELKMFINKDSVGNIRFKVPVEQGGSWVIHGQHFTEADLDKGFADGRIKMIFVPDSSGHGAHEAITFQINPAAKELIIPPDSNIRNLFDENTGMPKGGYFGLAEQVGVRPDGSSNYTWINSLRGNGGHVNFGQNVWQDDIRVVGPAAAEAVSDYNSPTIPTVPPQRKVFMRPEERAKVNEKKKKKEEEKKKKEEEKAKKKAEKEAKKKAKEQLHSSAGHGESGGGGGGGGGQQEAKKAVEKKGPEVKAPEFKGDVLKRYTDKKYAADLLEKYNEKPEGLAKIDLKSIKFVIEGKKGLNIPVKKDLAKAVWELEQALVVGKVISQDKADEFYEEVSEPAPTPVKPEAGAGKPVRGATRKDEVPAGAFKADKSEGGADEVEGGESSENKGYNFAEERRVLEEEWGHKFNFRVPNNGDRRNQAAGALANLGRALNLADERSVKTALDKIFEGRDKEGLFVEFDTTGGQPRFEEGKLILPVNARPGEILKALETVGVKRKVRPVDRPARPARRDRAA